ncbi:metallophosphoesterase [Clostridium diolis]|uniref:metallophosphoesterase n=1 Tax=Clostridium diolis TaxID=223919 RepID=UPI00242038F0|nr:metallophosphoesterase [Clostridium diolis]
MIASYWLVFIVYFAIFIGIIECFFVLGNILQFIPINIKLNANVLFYIALIILFTVMIIILYGTINAKNATITPYNIDLPRKAGKISKLQIALLSDIHLGNLMDKRIDKLIDKINSIQPDIVLIAGDIIDSNRDMINYDFF